MFKMGCHGNRLDSKIRTNSYPFCWMVFSRHMESNSLILTFVLTGNLYLICHLSWRIRPRRGRKAHPKGVLDPSGSSDHHKMEASPPSPMGMGAESCPKGCEYFQLTKQISSWQHYNMWIVYKQSIRVEFEVSKLLFPWSIYQLQCIKEILTAKRL